MGEAATNKDGAVCQQPGAAETESLDSVLKLLTKHHSDMTFLTWPQELERAHVTVHSEGSKKSSKKKPTPTSCQKISVAKYRHIMTQDDQDLIPFSACELTDTATQVLLQASAGQ